jgi:signal transduction histidine kinase
MRRRLTLTMVLMVFGALVLAGLASLALAVQQSRTQTRHELVREAQALALSVPGQAAGKADPGRALRTLLDAMQKSLRLQGSAVVAVSSSGQLFNAAAPRAALALPSGLSAGDLQPDALQQDRTVSGMTGGGLVYAAAPYQAQLQIPALGTPTVTQAIVLTRRPPTGLATAGLWFGLSSLVILAVAFVVAHRLGRRMVRPFESVQQVAGRIAAGDLDARLPVPADADSELASLAGSINQMADGLARAQGAERQFLLSVSHDLRTPLTSIRGFAEAIEDGLVADVPAAAEVIASESRRLERLVGDLLALATLEARRFTLQPAPVDLAASTASSVAGFGPSAAELGLSLLVESQPDGPVFVIADPDRLAQVTANLIENALRFARGEVRVTVRHEESRPELWVEDDGPGIASADLPRVFDRLFAAGPRPGRPITSGLGLAIVAELVAAMGGTVRAESPLGGAGGTRMVVALPPASPVGP